MSKSIHYETAPQDRIPFPHKLVYGLGAFINNLLAASIGGMIIVLNLGLGMNPALVGLLGALPRLTDALTDPLMGYISDTTRSRWGRRRPYIFVGAIAAGVIYALLWQLPIDKSETFYFWYFLGGSLIFYLAYTMFATPWVALGYELTPDYHERTRLMGVQNFIGQIPYMISGYFLAIMFNQSWFDNSVDGAAGLAIIIGVLVVVVGVLPAIFLRERFQEIAETEAQQKHRQEESLGAALARNMRSFFSGFLITLKFKPFLKLCAATFLVFNGFMLIAAFQSYVIIYYVFRGDAESGSVFVGHSMLVGAVSTLFVIAFVTWLGTKIGKRRAFFVTTGISMLGYALKWFAYNPDYPWLVLLPAPLMAFGLGGLFTLMPSMIADVVDEDELITHERREGMYGSIFWWVVKLGMAAALAIGGVLLNLTGFDVALGGEQTASTIVLMRLFDAFVPFIASGIAIWAIATFTLTEQRAHEVRLELEKRRGAPVDPVTEADDKLTKPKPKVMAATPRELSPGKKAVVPPREPTARTSRGSGKQTMYSDTKQMALSGIDFSGMSDEDLRALFRRVLSRKIHGLSFGPYVEGQGPGTELPEKQIRERLRIIQDYVYWIRSFSCTDGNQATPGIAHENGLKTMVGVWLESDLEKNEKEFNNAIEVARAGHANIVAIGNEVLLRGDLSEDVLIDYLSRFKQAVPGVQVGYVDAYFKFVDHPRVTAACDVILANCYPFWEGCHADYALLYMKEMYRRAVNAAQGKKVIISETGWPNIGTPVGGAVPSEINAIRYFLNTCQWADEEGIEIFYFSSFDEAWKIHDEGDVGAYWGLWDKDGKLKYG